MTQASPSPIRAGRFPLDVRPSSLSKLCRIVGTGFGFVSLGLGGLFLCIAVFPFAIFTTRNPLLRKLRVRRIIGHTFAFYLSILEFLSVLDLKVSKLESFQSLRGSLIICNHPTLLDVVIIMAQLKDVQCVVKSKLWKNVFIGGVVRAAGYMRNDVPPEQFLEDCKTQLDRGETILIFPEGTRSQPNTPLEMHRGIGNLALGANANIHALIMTCEPLTLTKENYWYKVPPQKPLFHLQGGRTFFIENYFSDEPRSLRVRALMRDIQGYYNRYFEYE